MFNENNYQLLDFGNGRRLERFGEIVLDRPCPVAEGIAQADAAAWQKADARFESINEREGQWVWKRDLPDRWNIEHDLLKFELRHTPFGHVGLFPEQAENWDWISKQCHSPALRESAERFKVLNLFAYTGASTLAAAAAGAEVVHIDAAQNIVAWGRRNAELSGLSAAPIHWIVEDAMKFVKRELKRKNFYDAVILDPPSYGHGRRGEVWRLSKHLPQLLSICSQLTAGKCRFLLLTCHTPGYDAVRLADMIEQSFPDINSSAIEPKTLTIRSATGRELPSGAVVRWARNN